MIPHTFGAGGRRLFGIHVPAAAPRKPRGIVLCPPIGAEYFRAHRSLRILAERFAAAGCDAMRFDYYGTGDSDGHAADLTLSGAVADVRSAVDELSARGGIRNITLVGLRLGGTVALRAAADLRQADRLVLWDPIADGRSHLRELLIGPNGSGAPPAGDLEAHGFVMGRQLHGELSELTPAPFRLPPHVRRVLVINSSEAAAEYSFSEDTSGERVQLSRLPGPAVWEEQKDLGVGAIRSDVLDLITTWNA